MIFYNEDEIIVCSYNSVFAVNIIENDGFYYLFKGRIIYNSNATSIERISDHQFIFADRL